MDKHAFQWRTFFVMCILISGLLSTIWRWVPPFYFTNDDVLLRLTIEGHAVPGEPPTGYLLNTHSALGWALVYLQRVVPAAPIWDLTLAIVLMWAFAVLFTLAWNALGHDGVARSVSTLAMFAGVVPIVFGLQFTVSSTLAGGAAITLGFFELAGDGRPRRSVLAMSVLLLLAGLLVRPIGAAAGAFATGFLLVPLASWHPANRRFRLTRLALILGTTLVLIVLMQYTDHALYALSREWNAYYQYHWSIVRLLDWAGGPSGSQIDAIRGSAGWTPNDWKLFEGSWGVDPMHGVDRLARAYAAYENVVSQQGWTGALSARMHAFDPQAFGQLIRALTVVMITIVAVAATLATRRAVVLSLVVALFFCGLCVAIQIVVKELPYRLLAPLETSLAATLVLTIGALGGLGDRRPSVISVSALLLIVAIEARSAAAQSLAEEDQSRATELQVSELLHLEPSLVVLHSDAFTSENWWRPFHRPRINLPVIQLGLNDQNPSLQHFLTATGRQPLLRTLCVDPSLIVVSERGRLDAVTTYWREHLHQDVQWTQVYSGSFRAWRCSVESKTPASPAPR